MIAYLAASALFSLLPFPLSAASAGLPYCNGLRTIVTETPEYVSPRKLVLNGDHLRLWVERSVPRNTKATETMVIFDENWGVGYELDKSAVTGIIPISAPELTMIVSFSHLSKGPHHLRVGLMSPDGQLEYGNALCFFSPGHFSLTGP
jgi:hypothetical protein